MATLTTSAKMLPPVPLEPTITSDQEYNNIFRVTPKSSDVSKDLNIARSLADLLGTQLTGCSKCDLIGITLSYVTTAMGQYVYMGIANANATLTAKQIGLAPGGHTHVSNAFNVGIKTEVKLIIPDTLTRQIQPSSSLVMPGKFYLKVSPGVDVTIDFYVLVHGPRIVCLDMSF